MLVINFVPPKAADKLELLFKKPASRKMPIGYSVLDTHLAIGNNIFNREY
jgi:hypothetical protein